MFDSDIKKSVQINKWSTGTQGRKSKGGGQLSWILVGTVQNKVNHRYVKVQISVQVDVYTYAHNYVYVHSLLAVCIGLCMYKCILRGHETMANSTRIQARLSLIHI